MWSVDFGWGCVIVDYNKYTTVMDDVDSGRGLHLIGKGNNETSVPSSQCSSKHQALKNSYKIKSILRLKKIDSTIYCLQETHLIDKIKR